MKGFSHKIEAVLQSEAKVLLQRRTEAPREEGAECRCNVINKSRAPRSHLYVRVRRHKVRLPPVPWDLSAHTESCSHE